MDLEPERKSIEKMIDPMKDEENTLALVEKLFFCDHCHFVMRNEIEVMHHLKAVGHNCFLASTSSYHQMYCAHCEKSFSSLMETQDHTCRDELFYANELPPRFAYRGDMTPSVKHIKPDEGTAAPMLEKYLKRISKGSVTPLPFPCLEEAADPGDDEAQDHYAHAFAVFDYVDDEGDEIYSRCMSKQMQNMKLVDKKGDFFAELYARLSQNLKNMKMGVDSDDSDDGDEDRPDFQVPSNTRRLKNLINPRHEAGEREILRKKYIIAESLPRLKALKRVKKITEWHAKHGFLSRPLRKIVFDPVLKHVCLERVTIPLGFPDDRLRYSDDVAARMLKILEQIEYLLENDKPPMRQNMLHYMYETKFEEKGLMPEHSGQRFSRAVNEISLVTKLTRESLRIRPSPKGLIRGEVEFYSLNKKGDEKLLCYGGLGGESGNSIPSESDEITRVKSVGDINYVLVIEKDTVFHHLTSMGFPETEHCVLVCGKGQSDVATRILLRKLKDHLTNTPFYALVDCNPSGAQIFCTYCFGAEERAHDNLFLTLPTLQYIGLHVSDVSPSSLIPLNETEINLADNIIAKMQKYIPVSVTRDTIEANLARMKHEGKANLDLFIDKEGTLVQLIRKNIQDSWSSQESTKKIRKPEPWKHSQTITVGELKKMRDEFWNTAPKNGGQKEIWNALRAAAEAEVALAQTIVESAGVIVSNADLTLCYDERGAKYELPMFVLSEPTNLVQDS